MQLRALKYERMKLRHALFTVEPKKKKARADLAELESDIDDDWIVEYENEQRKLAIERMEKRFMKDNEKLAADGKEMKDSELEKKRKAINAEYDKLKKERGTGKATLKQNKSVEQIEALIEKQDAKIKTFKIQMNSREETKTVSLGTRCVCIVRSQTISDSRAVRLTISILALRSRGARSGTCPLNGCSTRACS